MLKSVALAPLCDFAVSVSGRFFFRFLPCCWEVLVVYKWLQNRIKSRDYALVLTKE